MTDSALLYALTAFLILPLFRVAYLANWGSIDATFIAHARFLIENWPHPLWDRWWYCGTRFDYIYPPALPYGTAALSMLFSEPAARAYHIYTALFYCFGTVGLYVLVRVVSGSRAMAWAAAAMNALLSPSFLFLSEVANDAWHCSLCPERLNALVRWGEGPHMSALALIPLALAAAYHALTRRSFPAEGAAAALCALAVSNNFYGAVALAIFYPLLVWSVWVTHQQAEAWLWAAAIPALAYGLTAFWLTPSYLRVTTENLARVQASGKLSHGLGALAAGALFLAVSYWFGRFRKDLCHSIFVLGAALAFAIPILGGYWFGLQVFGSAERFLPEMDIALILLWLEICRQIALRAPIRWPRQGTLWRGAAAVLAVAPLWFSAEYLRHAWAIYEPDADYQERVEYRTQQWMNDNFPEARTYVEGSIRFWYNAWNDLQQVTGGSHQGMLNQRLGAAEWNVRWNEDGRWSREWLLAFGADAVVVTDETSRDAYQSFDYPRKFDGLLPVLFDSGRGEVIYRVPRRFASRARVVDEAVARMRPIDEDWARDRLQAYVTALEEGPDSPVTLAWSGPETIRLSAEFEPGQTLLVQQSYDPYWRAYDSGGREVEVREDMMGQMLVSAPPGRQEIRLQFELPLENRVGRVVSVLAGVCVLGLLAVGPIRRPR